MDDFKELSKAVKLYAEKVQNNVEVVTPKETGVAKMLHISTDNKLKTFTPAISKRQADSEDRTVPRATVSTNILGCMIGYGSLEFDFMVKAAAIEKGDGLYRGGYVVYGIEYGACLRPNNKLVYDASLSHEHWLVTYSKDTVTYETVPLAKMFIHTLTQTGRSGDIPISEMDLYVEVFDEEILFSPGISLKKGYWKIHGPTQRHVKNYKSDKDYTAKEIDKEKYLEAKTLSADLLSYQEVKAPIYNSW